MNPLSAIGPRAIVAALVVVGVELALDHGTHYGDWVVQERDAELGFRLLPDQERWSKHHDVPEVINGHGYRDRDWGAPGDDGAFRVAIVGNSITYGSGVAIEDTWGRVLEDRLRAELAPREVVVMNFAVQGYVLEQMALAYEHDVRPYRPDLVVFPNVPRDIVPFEPGDEEFAYPYRNLVVRTATHDFLDRAAIRPWRSAVALPGVPDAAESEIARLDRAVQQRPFAPEQDPLWAAAAERLAEVQAQVETDGGRLVLVNLPLLSPLFRPQGRTTTERWAPWAASRGELDGRARVLHVDALPAMRSACDDLVRAVGARGFERAVPTTDEGRRFAPDLPHLDQSPFLEYDLGHYNARGHRLVGEAVFAALVQADLLD